MDVVVDIVCDYLLTNRWQPTSRLGDCRPAWPAARDASALAATGGLRRRCSLGSASTGYNFWMRSSPIPLGLTLGGVSVPAVTKAGGFGNEGCLRRIIERLRFIRQDGHGGMSLPTIAITMGDAAGVGPEIVMKALGASVVRALCSPLVIGDAARLRRAGELVREHARGEEPHGHADEARYSPDKVECIDLKLIPADLPFGKTSAIAGEAAYRYIERAVRIVEQGGAQAICTAPLSKEALHAAGHKYPGHTELLAALTHTPEVSMITGRAETARHSRDRISVCSTPLRRIDAALVERVIGRAHETRAFRHPRSRLACAASIRTPAKTVCSVAEKRPSRLFRRWRRRAPAG
jgi:4-hydroxythreonine-4-phosphate dehydrogenase